MTDNTEEQVWNDCIGAKIVSEGNRFVIRMAATGSLILPFKRQWRRRGLSEKRSASHKSNERRHVGSY